MELSSKYYYFYTNSFGIFAIIDPFFTYLQPVIVQQSFETIATVG